MLLYVFIALIIIYIVFVVLFPAPDSLQHVIIDQTQAANSLGPNGLSGLVTPLKPAIELETGGEYTFQTWMYISNWDYKSGQPKHVFTIGSNSPSAQGRQEHANMVGILYPNENKLAIRVYQNPSDNSGPDFTLNESPNNLGSLMANSLPGAFSSTVGYPICDINNIDLQKWISLGVVVSGRIIDVYIDGKLARSCVTKGIPTVEGPTGYVTMGGWGGWGGNVSTTSMFGYALTPGQLYEIYQKGPANISALDPKNGFLGWLMKRLGINIYFWSSVDDIKNSIQDMKDDFNSRTYYK
jgi:hypothetical protein